MDNRSVSVCWLVTAVALGLLTGGLRAARMPSRGRAEQALKRAVSFFRSEVASHGGYVYRYSADLRLREAEGTPDEDTIWVQPPGTPLVGQAFLDAYQVTGEKVYLEAAREAGMALVRGQLHSGGWSYSISFDSEGRRRYSYRRGLHGELRPPPTDPRDRKSGAGWYTWKKRKYEGNKTVLDDDTTQAALRFLARLDCALEFDDEQIHDAAKYGLQSLMNSQYAVGAWSANYDRFPEVPPDPERYPPLPASYPEDWSRSWTKKFAGCYVNNDDVTVNATVTMLYAWETYDDERYRRAAERAGEFFILAQMPEPQPAWAQQYNDRMQPVWDRAFEPPAVSALESQTILEALVMLARKTGELHYLAPVPGALEYLRRSKLADGRFSRFYELRTNRPLYFTRSRKHGHVPTYSDDDVADNYTFKLPSRLDAIEAEYRRVLAGDPSDYDLRPYWMPLERLTDDLLGARASEYDPEEEQEVTPELARKVKRVMESQDARGAWVEDGRLGHHGVTPEGGIITTRTFAQNVRTLCRFLAASR